MSDFPVDAIFSEEEKRELEHRSRFAETDAIVERMYLDLDVMCDAHSVVQMIRALRKIINEADRSKYTHDEQHLLEWLREFLIHAWSIMRSQFEFPEGYWDEPADWGCGE